MVRNPIKYSFLDFFLRDRLLHGVIVSIGQVAAPVILVSKLLPVRQRHDNFLHAFLLELALEFDAPRCHVQSEALSFRVFKVSFVAEGPVWSINPPEWVSHPILHGMYAEITVSTNNHREPIQFSLFELSNSNERIMILLVPLVDILHFAESVRNSIKCFSRELTNYRIVFCLQERMADLQLQNLILSQIPIITDYFSLTFNFFHHLRCAFLQLRSSNGNYLTLAEWLLHLLFCLINSFLEAAKLIVVHFPESVFHSLKDLLELKIYFLMHFIVIHPFEDDIGTADCSGNNLLQLL